MRSIAYRFGPVVAVLLAGACGGGEDLIVNDDGVSSGGVAIELINPPRGPLPGGQDLTISGSGFAQSGTEVVIGDRLADRVVVRSGSELQVKTPPGIDPATVDVIVFTNSGFASRTNGYSYNPLPTVTAIAANRGPAAGGNTVTITGTGFQEFEAGNNLVDFGPYHAETVTVVSDTELSVAAPPSAFEFELVDVVVANQNGSASLELAYQYRSPGFIAARAQRNRQNVGELYFVSATTGASRFIGQTRDADGTPLFFTGLVFDGETLLGADRTTNSLYSIDLNSGIGTLIGPFGGGITNIQGMSIRGGVLYGVERQPQVRLVSINRGTGAVTEFTAQNLPCCQGGALVTNNSATTTFMTSNNQVFVVDVATGIAAPNPVSFGGGGLKGLAFVGDDLYGFENSFLPPPFSGGGGSASTVLVKLNLVAATKQTIGFLQRFCAMASVPQ